MPGEKDREQVRMMLAYLSNTTSGERLDQLEGELRTTLDHKQFPTPGSSEPPQSV